MQDTRDYRIVHVFATHERWNAVSHFLHDACKRTSDKIRKTVHLTYSIVVYMERSLDADHTLSIDSADIVVADVTDSYPDILMSIGNAIALRKPVVVISHGEGLRFRETSVHRLVYDRTTERAFVPQLTRKFSEILASVPHDAGPRSVEKLQPAPTVFISYAHADAECLVRLRTHLKPIERLGVVEVWDDRHIRAGENWQAKIQGALKSAAVAVLLVSADFLASEFIAKNELPPLLAAAEHNGTVVLPLIIKPCRFLRDASLAAFQAVNDPHRPLIALSVAEQEQLYANIAERIETLLQARSA